MQQQPTPEPLINHDPVIRFIDWFVDATFEQVLKELEKQTA